MVFELIEIAIIIGAGYFSIFEWIKKKDIKSNEKNDFSYLRHFWCLELFLRLRLE